MNIGAARGSLTLSGLLILSMPMSKTRVAHHELNEPTQYPKRKVPHLPVGMPCRATKFVICPCVCLQYML